MADRLGGVPGSEKKKRKREKKEMGRKDTGRHRDWEERHGYYGGGWQEQA